MNFKLVYNLYWPAEHSYDARRSPNCSDHSLNCTYIVQVQTLSLCELLKNSVQNISRIWAIKAADSSYFLAPIQILNPLSGWGFIACFIALFNTDFSSGVKRFTSFRILFLPTCILHSGLQFLQLIPGSTKKSTQIFRFLYFVIIW